MAYIVKLGDSWNSPKFLFDDISEAAKFVANAGKLVLCDENYLSEYGYVAVVEDKEVEVSIVTRKKMTKQEYNAAEEAHRLAEEAKKASEETSD